MASQQVCYQSISGPALLEDATSTIPPKCKTQKHFQLLQPSIVDQYFSCSSWIHWCTVAATMENSHCRLWAGQKDLGVRSDQSFYYLECRSAPEPKPMLNCLPILPSASSFRTQVIIDVVFAYQNVTYLPRGSVVLWPLERP